MGRSRRIWTSADASSGSHPRFHLEETGDLFTLSAAAIRVGRRRATVRAWVQKGLLPYMELDGSHTKYVIREDLLAAFRHQLKARRLPRSRDESGRFSPSA